VPLSGQRNWQQYAQNSYEAKTCFHRMQGSENLAKSLPGRTRSKKHYPLPYWLIFTVHKSRVLMMAGFFWSGNKKTL
jgi:hypothetical protein